MILTNSTSSKIGTLNVAAITSRSASVIQYKCYGLAKINSTQLGSFNLEKSGVGTLQYFSVYVGTHTGTIKLNQGVFLIQTNAASYFEGVISGAGSIKKDGITTTTFNGNNTYSGGTELYGNIVAGNNNAFGSGTITGIANTTIQQTTDLVLPNNITSIWRMGFTVNTGATMTLTGNISGLNGSMYKLGGGYLSLNGNLLTYTGLTNVAQGFIIVTKTVGASTATATFSRNGLSIIVSFDVSPPSGVTEFRFFPGTTFNTFTITSLTGVPAGTTATYSSSTSTLSVTVP